MDPLIITATPNICWLSPDVPYPHTVADIATEVVDLAHKLGREIASAEETRKILSRGE
jgi:hypothetical protein